MKIHVLVHWFKRTLAVYTSTNTVPNFSEIGEELHDFELTLPEEVQFRMSLEDWYAEFEPVEEDDGTLTEVAFTDEKSLKYYLKEKLIWTEYDNDVIVPGVYWVNRLRYLVSNKPWTDTQHAHLQVYNVSEVSENDLKSALSLIASVDADSLELLESMLKEWLEDLS